MSTTPLPLSVLCFVSVNVTPAGAAVPSFNQGLIIGPNLGFRDDTATGPVVIYASVADMISAGFAADDPEVDAATLYFGQTPPPQYVAIGWQDPSTLDAFTITTPGTGYTVGQLLTLTGETENVQLKVTTINGSGGITGLQIVNPGTNVALGSIQVQAPVAGTDAFIDVTSIGATAQAALTACRAYTSAWYLAMNCTGGLVAADHVACALFAQSATPPMQYLYSTQDAAALTGATGNVFSLIKAAGYSRAHGTYSTVQGGGAPNNAYAAAAVMGKALGLNTGLANSNFTLALKSLVGVTPEPISLAQFSVFGGVPGEGTGNNGNAYLNFANSYTFYEQGVNGNGTWFDQVLGLDQLAADAQISVLNLVESVPSIPQTDAGQSMILNAVQGACDRAAARGFIAGGIYNGATVLNLTAGTALPNGYKVQSAGFSTQSPAGRALRKSMPVYVTVLLAGSQQSFTIGINVQQ